MRIGHHISSCRSQKKEISQLYGVSNNVVGHATEKSGVLGAWGRRRSAWLGPPAISSYARKCLTLLIRIGIAVRSGTSNTVLPLHMPNAEIVSLSLKGHPFQALARGIADVARYHRSSAPISAGIQVVRTSRSCLDDPVFVVRKRP